MLTDTKFWLAFAVAMFLNSPCLAQDTGLTTDVVTECDLSDNCSVSQLPAAIKLWPADFDEQDYLLATCEEDGDCELFNQNADRFFLRNGLQLVYLEKVDE